MFKYHWCKRVAVTLKIGESVLANYLFLSRHAGMEKSHVIKMIQWDVNYFFDLYKQTISDDSLVLVTAYTGTAPFNIKGITLHSALCLPTTPKHYLFAEKRATLQAWLHQLKPFVINQVSMIPDKMLELSHKIFCTSKQADFTAAPNANRYVPVVSDFCQLYPVGGLLIFAKQNPHKVND